MKMVESSDGTVKVIELDPSMLHWLIVDCDAIGREDLERITKEDGVIILKRPGTRIEIIEGAGPPDGFVRFSEPKATDA